MNADDFFKTTLVSGAADPWSPSAQVPTRDGLDETFLDSLRRGPSPTHPDVEVALALGGLINDELMASGTGGG